MIWLTLLMAVVQSGWTVEPAEPLVGDTVSIALTLPVDPEVRVRLQEIDAGEAVQPLRKPEVSVEGNSRRVEYLVAFFEPGTHRLSMPDLELVRPDGSTERVVGGVAVVEIAPVLPPGASGLEPKWSKAPLGRYRSRLWPVLLFPGVVALLAVIWMVARNRRAVRPVGSPEVEEWLGPPLMKWISFGEPRVVAGVASEHLRSVLARFHPDLKESLAAPELVRRLDGISDLLPVRDQDLANLVVELDRARFAPAVPSDVVELVERAERAVAKLEENPRLPAEDQVAPT